MIFNFVFFSQKPEKGAKKSQLQKFQQITSEELKQAVKDNQKVMIFYARDVKGV